MLYTCKKNTLGFNIERNWKIGNIDESVMFYHFLINQDKSKHEYY